MKRFTLSTFSLSAFSVVIAVGAIAPTAKALPQVDADFKLQSLRLEELDARNKGELSPDFKLQSLRLEALDARNKGEESYYPQTYTQPSAQTVSSEEEGYQTTEPAAWEPADEPAAWEPSKIEKETDAQTLSLTERRQQALDRS